MEDWQEGGFGVYVHWPFCQSKCPYCDFNSHVAGQIDQSRWLKAYRHEIERTAQEIGPRVVRSVYFGGGTPSLMQPETVGGILEAVRAAWPQSNDVEITLEANPTSVEAGRLEGYRDSGVNRVSLGVQAMNDADLRRLGRMHSAAEAMEAFATARSIFDRVNFDLIYARQEQSREDWRRELTSAIALGPDHLSLYQLTIEDGTVFGDRFAKGQLRGLPNEDIAADMFLATQEICEGAGLPAYEISNHARPGQESRHNLIYWRGGDYAGIGPGAHGRVTLAAQRWATVAARAPGDWLQKVEATGRGEEPREIVDADERFAEYVMMGLRLREGIDLERAAGLLGQPMSMERIWPLIEMGKLELDGPRLSVTAEGRIVLNAVLRELLA